MAYDILEERIVKFEPRGVMKSMDFSKAINKLNRTEQAEELAWEVAGDHSNLEYQAKNEDVDLVIGNLSGDVEAVMMNAAFLVKSMDPDLSMKIQIINNNFGRQLKNALDNGMSGMRFTANLELGDDINHPTAFNRFFIAVDKPVETLPEVKSSSIILS